MWDAFRYIDHICLYTILNLFIYKLRFRNVYIKKFLFYCRFYRIFHIRDYQKRKGNTIFEIFDVFHVERMNKMK